MDDILKSLIDQKRPSRIGHSLFQVKGLRTLSVSHVAWLSCHGNHKKQNLSNSTVKRGCLPRYSITDQPAEDAKASFDSASIDDLTSAENFRSFFVYAHVPE